MIEIAPDLVLKPFELADASDIFNAINNQREYLREWLPFVDITIEVSDTLSFITKMLESKDKGYTIRFKNEFIGLVGFNNTDTANQKTEIGYWLSEKHQGKGIITQSVKRLLAFAFNDLDLNRVVIKAGVKNTKSRNIPGKLGFTLEGIERDGEILVDNKFTDLAIYSLLKKEFTI